MPVHYLVRVGSMATIGRFRPVDASLYPRATRVIVRTPRGLETGEVLAAVDTHSDGLPPAGSLLRAMTVEDHLLESRLLDRRSAAIEECRRRLATMGQPVNLLDVELLFDGRTLIFYFLGDTDQRLSALADELAEAYESVVQFRRFAATVEQGCGPDCGTDRVAGCTTCAVACAAAQACVSTRPGTVPAARSGSRAGG